jgi:ribosomal protein S18 acetylase RimI-like enzyme
VTTAVPRFVLRAAEPGDREFLAALYASTREQELAPLPWTDGQKAAFLCMQFEAQQRHYEEHYPAAERSIVVCEGQAVGRFWVDRGEDGFLVLDIALLPAWRGRGIGGALLEALIAEADACGRAVTLHVERFNPARRLYDRLGFRKKSEEGPYDLLERLPLTVGG